MDKIWDYIWKDEKDGELIKQLLKSKTKEQALKKLKKECSYD